jgi:MFS family permease
MATAFVQPGERKRSEDIPLPQRILAFVFMLFADFFYGWSWNTVDVLRPYMRDSLDLSLTQAGSLYSALSGGALIGAIIIGQLADRIGRRNALFGIMVGYSTSLIASSYATTYGEALAARFAIGFFLGGIFPTVVGLYTSLFDRRVCGKLASFYNGTFNLSVVLLGFAVSTIGGESWRDILFYGGLPALIAAPFIFLIVPNDRLYRPYGGPAETPVVAKLPVVELFRPELRRRTFSIAAMVGLNFFAYQAFTGWMTTYLAEVRGLPAVEVGALVSWQFIGSIAGGFFWGWLSDRIGRRTNAVGFLLASGFIVLFLWLPNDITLLRTVGLLYGFSLSASVIWGPWIAELFPPHLRSTAASIFNWGRIISFFAPLITATVAQTWGLTAGMMLAAFSFAAAALVWLSLPETVERRKTAL